MEPITPEARAAVERLLDMPDPAVIEAIVNIKMAIRRLAPIAEWTATGGPYSEIQEAMADLQQAVRWLEGKEEPA